MAQVADQPDIPGDRYCKQKQQAQRAGMAGEIGPIGVESPKRPDREDGPCSQAQPCSSAQTAIFGTGPRGPKQHPDQRGQNSQTGQFQQDEHVLADAVEQGRREIAFGKAGQDGNDPLAVGARAFGDLDRGGNGRARGDATGDAFDPGKQASMFESGLVGDRQDLVDQLALEHTGDEPGPDALDLVRARITA